jgi:hypothetical protein
MRITDSSRTSRDVRKVPLGDMRAWRELKEATHEVVFADPPNISDVALILAAHTPMTEKPKVPSKIAGRFGVSSGEKVPIKVVAIYVFI